MNSQHNLTKEEAQEIARNSYADWWTKVYIEQVRRGEREPLFVIKRNKRESGARKERA